MYIFICGVPREIICRHRQKQTTLFEFYFWQHFDSGWTKKVLVFDAVTIGHCVCSFCVLSSMWVGFLRGLQYRPLSKSVQVQWMWRHGWSYSGSRLTFHMAMKFLCATNSIKGNTGIFYYILFKNWFANFTVSSPAMGKISQMYTLRRRRQHVPTKQSLSRSSKVAVYWKPLSPLSSSTPNTKVVQLQWRILSKDSKHSFTKTDEYSDINQVLYGIWGE